MTILCLADIHLKLGQKNVPKDWALKRYEMFFEQVSEIEKTVSRIIIPGDIFDRVPTLEELTLYFKFISQRKVKTIISTGNHESTKKERSFFTELKEVSERLNPLVEIVVDYIYDDGIIYVVPYEFIKKEETWNNLEPRPVFTHVRGEIPPHVKPEIDLDLLSKFPVVFAGDLHSHSNTQRNIVYPGSPMTTSFHRNEVSTGYLLIDGLDWTWHAFDLPQLIRKTVGDPSEMVPTSYHHTVYELEGDAVSLSKVRNTDLLDKKLIKKASEATLVLNPKMSMVEELVEYLRYVLELPDSSIEEIVKVYNDYS